MSNKILERKYYRFTVRLASPLNISAGRNSITDSDVLLNHDNEPFVPGASLAGAFRSYIEQEKSEDGFMGFSKGEKGRMSPIIISDLSFVAAPARSVRDGVRLNEDRTAADTSKYDMEILETGAEGDFRIEIVKRENDSNDYDAFIRRIVNGLCSGDIRLGKKKNRGFGRIYVTKIEEQTFTKDNQTDWINFCEKPFYSKTETVEEWLGQAADNEKYVKIRVPLRLTGGISIRTYSAKPGEPDYAHITCANEPVIPGSSWNGAVRADVSRILNDLHCRQPQSIVNGWFGADAKCKNHEQSMVVFSESVIAGSLSMNMTRNKINRFSAATIETALYTERATVGGTTVLEILLDRKRLGDDLEPLLGILSIVISDIVRGYVPVGGQVAVGRGIFAANGEACYCGIEVNEKLWLEKLYARLVMGGAI